MKGYRKAVALALAAGLAGCAMSTDGETTQNKAPDPAAEQAGALLTWPQFLARPRPAPDRTIRYGEHERQVVDVYLPQGSGPHPVVVMIHGGCWSAPWDRTLMNQASDDLRRRGIAVWNIDYRVIEDGSGYPHVFEDAWSAIVRLSVDGHALGLDPQRVVAVGHSAGGHLALWYAARLRRWVPPPNVRMIPPTGFKAVISLGGLPDLESAARPPGSGCGTEVIGQLIGRGRPRWQWRLDVSPPFPAGDPYADTSVPRIGALGVPQVLINGTEDRIIPTHFAEDYTQRMRALGDDVRVRFIPRTGHVELIAPESAAWAATVAEIEQALGRGGR